jgi:uncharacterized protein
MENYIKRNIDAVLLKWIREKNRKPLMIRGARQIGKSSSVKNLGKQFKHFITINFDEDNRYVQLFENANDVKDLCQQLEVLVNTPIIENETLLFLDEVQACPKAITILRYFYEKIPNLHVVVAGSLLEFTLAEIPTLGVGRIRSIFMYPFSFNEFLLANKENKLLEAVQKANTKNPLPNLIHQKCIAYFKKFLLVGGMPEAVSTYVQSKNLLSVQQILDDLIITMQADFVKYKLKVPSVNILQVFKSVINQTGNKFMYSAEGIGLNNSQTKNALQLLTLAGLVYNVYHSSCNGIPLGADINEKKRKLLIFDTGIYQRLLGLDLSEVLIVDDTSFVNKGKLAELHIGLELIKNNFTYQLPELFYWQRESKSSNAEVDYIIQNQQQIIPIEVKANTKGSMQSLFFFLQEKHLKKGIRTSLENFGSIDKIDIYPLYAVDKFKNKF